MPTDLQTELCEAIAAYKACLETGTHCLRTAYKPTGDGSGYLPDVQVECVCIGGFHARQRLSSLQKRLNRDVQAALAEPLLLYALDAIPGGPYGSRCYDVDVTVNPSFLGISTDAPPCESHYYECVRAYVLGELDKVLARLSSMTSIEAVGVAGQGGERANIYVENVIVGDHITAQGSTVVTHSEVKGSSKIVRDDHSTSAASGAASRTKRALSWLHKHYLAPLIVILVGAAVVVWIGLGQATIP